ncbi:MAG: PEPxxWA-CTERM sorting domain-containing protein [Azoarcus sp.]|jgi:hypothetical protein|nr:PEPxxWA-CTERM sorting domain-containing protein [Azoarcus sp.]
MFKHKQLAALLLTLGSLSVSAAPPTGSLDPFLPSLSDGYEPTFGGDFYIVNQAAPVELSFLHGSAGWSFVISVASLDSNKNIISNWESILNKNEQGYNNPNYGLDHIIYTPTAGATGLLFKIDVNSTGNTFYSGSAINTADDFSHVLAYYGYGPEGQTIIAFEDGGNTGFNDAIFYVSNVQSVPVPEPETWAMLLVGLGIVGAVTQRRKHK